MSHPRSESEYLSGLVPPSVAATGISRRGFLKGAAGAGAALSLPSLLAACGGKSSSGGGSGSSNKTVTFGSNQSDAVPKKAYAEMVAAFQKSSGLTVKTNTVEHNTFQQNINNYLQGNPDALLRRPGPGRRHQRRLERHLRDERGAEGGVDR
jgi:multiple sugar transport system substrate-binding protein